MVERVVSLAPSATTTIQELGEGNSIVGHTEDGSTASTAIGGWLTPDIDAIEALDPDLVITTDQLQRPIHETLQDRGIDAQHFEPTTLDDVHSYILAIGEALGVERAATQATEAFVSRIERVSASVAGRGRPIVYCEEWQHPPMVAGNWVPEVVELAGGRYPFLDPGERSREIARETVEGPEPEVVVLHICGRGEAVDPESVVTRGWDLPAIERDTITVIDDSLLNQPSPRLAEAVEKLAHIIHPGISTEA